MHTICCSNSKKKHVGVQLAGKDEAGNVMAPVTATRGKVKLKILILNQMEPLMSEVFCAAAGQQLVMVDSEEYKNTFTINLCSPEPRNSSIAVVGQMYSHPC